METRIEAAPGQKLTLLSVTPHQADHSFLETVIAPSRWVLLKASNLFAARAVLLKNQDISVVLCEDDLMPGCWSDILKHIQSLPVRPSLIITSQKATPELWADAIDRGAWNVLAKPFDQFEVLRSVKAASDHWHSHSRLVAESSRAS